MRLERELRADAEISAARASFEKACQRLRDILNEARAALQTLRLARIQPESIERLHRLVPDLRSAIAVFVNANHAITTSADAFLAQTGAHAAALAALPGILHDHGQFEGQLDALPPSPEDLLQQLVHIIEGVPAYAAATAAFQVVLAANLSNQQNVALYSALVELLQATRSVSLLATATSLERRLLDAQRAMDQYVLDRQNQAVAAREADMLAWYSRLSPNPDVRFSGIQPGRNEIALKAEAFGQELNAAAALSQSQLNCLGLSIYIPCVTDPGSPFHFIIFDDPVQAMDDDHHEAFLVNVIPQLLDVAKAQTIVLTHLRDTADRLRDCNYARDYIYYNFDRLQITGPVIVENIVLTDDMKKVRTLAEGNDDARDLAVDRIRVTCEHIMREAYFRAVGTRMPLPRRTAGQMVPFFGQVPAVTPQMLADIQDTISWSNPAHHSQPGYSPPVSANIRPHIERLQRMINDLGLKT